MCMDRKMNYNYVVFDEPGSYNRISRYDLNFMSECVIRESGYLPNASVIKQFLFKIHTSQKLSNKGLSLPFKSLWNKYIIGELEFEEAKPICFVFLMSLSRCFETDLFNYIRNHYPDCKIVLVRRDLIEVTIRRIRNGSVELLERTFDRIYTINSKDVRKYGFQSINVMCSVYPIPKINGKFTSDVVFVGKVKDRESIINCIYKKLTNSGLKCDFTLLSDGNEKKVCSGIRLIHTPMPYEEMLERTIKSKCILEVTQKNIESLSSRCLEALCYNKKLITDVKMVMSLKYYNPRFMLVFDQPDDINIDFIKSSETVDYHYDGYYSPINLIKYIDEDLVN